MTSLLSSATSQAAQLAHSAAASLSATQQIKPGAKIPDVKVKENEPDQRFSLADIPGRVLILGVPGAFTTPCSTQIPDYIKRYNDFQSRGVSAIYVVAVNDAFVTKAWKEKLAPEGTPIHFIADDQGVLTSALGLLFDGTELLGALRSKRYVLIVEDSKVKDIIVEAAPPDVNLTKAETILAKLLN